MIQFERQARMTGSMGVIDLCLKYDIDYAPITKALATAFAYVESRDPNAVKIQKDIQKNGIRPTVSKYIGRPEDNDVVVDRVVITTSNCNRKRQHQL